MGSSTTDLQRAWLLDQLGLTNAASNSALSMADLTALFYAAGGIKTVFGSGTYVPTDLTAAQSTAAPAVNTLYYAPITLRGGGVFSGIACEVTTLAATSVSRMGVYGRNVTTGKPDALLAAAVGTADQSTTGDKVLSFASTLTLTTGIYFLAWVQQVAPATIRTHANANYQTVFGTTNPASQNLNGYSQTGVSGALPANAGTLAIDSAIPRLFLKTA